jgi:PhnB protein
MEVNPYLGFNGTCDQALKFYEQVLGATTIFKQTWGNSPMCENMPAEMKDRIMHATIKLGSSTVMCADSPPEHYQKPQGIHVSLHFKDKAEGERIFQGLSEGGNVEMPFQSTFWSPGFGMCVDKFGIPWMVNCEGAAE